MDNFTKHRWVLGLHLVLTCAAYLITPLLTEDTYWIHYSTVALAWLLVPSFLLWCFWKSKVRTILIIFTLFTLNNFVDELLFDPQIFGWNEAFFGLTVLITPLLRLKRYG